MIANFSSKKMTTTTASLMFVLVILFAILMQTHHGEATAAHDDDDDDYDEKSLIPESRIVRGKVVGKLISFMAFIHLVVSACGGSFIGKRFVLTTAHCTESFNSTLGGHVILNSLSSREPFSPSAIRIKILSVISHERYNASNPVNGFDIGIVILERKVHHSLVNPVAYATKRNNQLLERMLRDVKLLGYGTRNSRVVLSSQRLRTTKLNILTMDECYRAIDEGFFRFSDVIKDFLIGNHHIMCMKDKSVEDSLRSYGTKGDSGGPILYRIPKGERKDYWNNHKHQDSQHPFYLQVGVYIGSLEEPITLKNVIDQAIRVSSFSEWIENVFKKKH